MTRRWVLLAGAALLVVALVGGRWLATETAERAWAGTIAGGDVLTEARGLARLLHGLVVLFSIAWATGNVLIVYRAIGSVQMPRRFGDIEIVEAVPQSVLLAIALAIGALGGIILSWGTGDWWRAAVLAADPPRFGTTDPILVRDLGYYVAVLPWHSTLQSHAVAMTAGGTAGVALLYAGIGSLRIQRRRIHASDRARAHLGALLACFALVVAWGAGLDPAQVVAGLHGPVDQALLDVRLPGAAFVASIAVATALASLVWAWRDRPTLIVGSWAALLLAVGGCYVVGPRVVRASGGEAGAAGTSLAAGRALLEREAFGLDALDERPSAPFAAAFASAEAAVNALPVWNADRVASVAGGREARASMTAAPWANRPSPGRAAWLVAPRGRGAETDAADRRPPRIAVEVDTGLALRPAPAADTVVWFGPDAGEFATASPDTWPAVRGAGVALAGRWRRAALAWTLQAPELTRAETDGRTLLWRRGVVDRLERLAPFAAFGTPAPALRDGALWWISWGYVASELFPLARALPWRGRDVRYARAGLVGAVRAATGESHVWLAPGYDSLTAAWARHFVPVIEPLAALPEELRAQLDYPAELFALAAAQLARAHQADRWMLHPRGPFQLALAARWTGIAVEAGPLRGFEGLLAGTTSPRGPRLHLWRPATAQRLPPELVGSVGTRPGEFRVWPAEGLPLTLQGQFFEPVDNAAEPRLAQVYLSLGARTGAGATPAAALRDLAAGGPSLALADTTPAARWTRARGLVAQMDSALARGDLERFAHLYRELARLLAPPPRPR